MLHINEAQITNKWRPIVESAGIDVKDQYKVSWLTKYCHFRTLNENTLSPTGYQTLANTNGMGAVSTGSTLGSTTNFYTGATGSGDKFPSLLPLAIQVAAKTVGFDIVNVIPMQGPTGVLTYMDYVYAGGKLDGSADKPMLIKIDVPKPSGFTAYTKGKVYWGITFNPTLADQTGFSIALKYVGKSRIDGSEIFQTIRTYNSSTNNASVHTATPNDAIQLSQVFDGAATTFIAADEADGTTVTVPKNDANWSIAVGLNNKASLVNALEDHIYGPTGAGASNTSAWDGNFIDGRSSYEPMERGVGESTPYNMMGVQVYTKFVQATTFQIGSSVTTEQIQDLNRQYGVDLISMTENFLVNEVSQSINKHILSRAFALGWTNNLEFFRAQGQSLNFRLDDSTNDTTSPAYITKDGTPVSIFVNRFTQVGTTGYENLHTLQRRVTSKVLAAGNIIAQRGRRGPANFVVTNLQLGTALQDSAQFTLSPMQNTINQNNGSLYPIGAIGGMTIYIDPNMEYNDTRILVGRKGGDQDPGLKFMPYLMAEPIQTIAEGTMSPKIVVKSRYALVEAGQLPQTMYYTIYVHLGTSQIV